VGGSRAVRVTTSVARPTTLDHMPVGIAGRVARNVALARLYEVRSATAPIVLGVVDTNRGRRQLRAITVLAAAFRYRCGGGGRTAEH
jgi:hypothetical protein